DELRTYAVRIGVSEQDVDNYIEEGNWKGRAGGRYLPNGGNRVIEQIEGNKVIFSLRQPAEDWEEWAKTLGRLVRTGKDQGFIERCDVSYPYQIRRFNNSIVIEVDGLGHADRYVFSAFRAVALKSAYCTHCQGCQVECPTGALNITDKVKIGENCTAC